MIKRSLSIVLLLLPVLVSAQNSGFFEIGRVQYRGGGDWYNDPSSLKNLISYTNSNVPISINPAFKDVALGSSEIQSTLFYS